VSLKHKREKLVKKLTNKEYRDAWVDESVKTVIPYQIQAIRNGRNWSQEILGIKAGMMKPNAVSRLESMNYGNLSISTLLRIAHGLDCGLLVKFVPFSRLVREFEDVSPGALQVSSFSDDYGSLMSWIEKVEEIDEFEVKPESFQKYSNGTLGYITNTTKDRDLPYSYSVESKPELIN
jgi:transcriptional regulator with XRE-family HTH domain